jgi:hypothetical protein
MRMSFTLLRSPFSVRVQVRFAARVARGANAEA